MNLFCKLFGHNWHDWQDALASGRQVRDCKRCGELEYRDDPSRDIIKYFIEHKKNRMWLCFDGTLTNDPHDSKLLKFDDEYTAQMGLEPKGVDITSDFSGKHVYYDNTTATLYNQLRDAAIGLGSGDLWKDFEITEHLYINSQH